MKKIIVNVTLPLLLINSLLPPTVIQQVARPRGKHQEKDEKNIVVGQQAADLIIGNLKLDAVLTMEETLQRLKNQLSQPTVDWAALAQTLHHLAHDLDLREADPAEIDELEQVLQLLRSDPAYDPKTLKKLSKDLSSIEADLARFLMERRSMWQQALVDLESESSPLGGTAGTGSRLGQYWTAMSGRFHFGIKDTDL